MSSLKEMLNLLLNHPELGHEYIASASGYSRRSVDRYGELVHKKRLNWSELSLMAESAIENTFRKTRAPSTRKVPDWAHVTELKASDRLLTLRAIWKDYRKLYDADALKYSRFAQLYAAYRKEEMGAQGLASLRRPHVGGQQIMVDFSGKTFKYRDRALRKDVKVELFVAVMPASACIFVYAVHSQKIADWLCAHDEMLKFYGGRPLVITPDNLKAAVIKSGKLPNLQRDYKLWGNHHDIAIAPARPGHPQDKGPVETAVRIVQREILSVLRQRKYFSLAQINTHIAHLLAKLNQMPLTTRSSSTRSTEFARLDKPRLRPLIGTPFTVKEWMFDVKVPNSYMVCVAKHSYTVPYDLIGEIVNISYDDRCVEIWREGLLVVSHVRSHKAGEQTTLESHLPPNHRAELSRNPDGLRAWANSVGPNLGEFISSLFPASNEWHGVPLASTIRDLCRHHSQETLEKAAKVALAKHATSLADFESALKTSLVPERDG